MCGINSKLICRMKCLGIIIIVITTCLSEPSDIELFSQPQSSLDVVTEMDDFYQPADIELFSQQQSPANVITEMDDLYRNLSSMTLDFSETTDLQLYLEEQSSMIFFTEMDRNLSSMILDFWEDHNVQFKVSKTKQLVFILGKNNRNKILLNLFVIGEELEIIEKSGEYIFVDKFGLINKYAESIIPELITDIKSTLDYYILPSWASITDLKHEIVITHLSHRVLDFSEAAKFVFTIDYKVVADGHDSNDDQLQEVREFVTYAATLLKNVSTFQDAITLIVMNVDCNPNKNDLQIRIQVVQIFRIICTEFRTKMEEKFIDLLIEDDYKRISIFRAANETGLVHDIEWMEKERMVLSKTIHSDTKYVTTEYVDFGYNFSKDAFKQFPSLIVEVKTRLSIGVSHIGDKIVQNFTLQESRQGDSKLFWDKMDSAYQTMKKLKSVDGVSFKNNLIEVIIELSVDVRIDRLNKVFDNLELYDFFINASYSRNVFPFESLFENVTQYFNESRIWYNFVFTLYESASEYKVQEFISDAQDDLGKLIDELLIPEYDFLFINKTSALCFLNKHVRLIVIEDLNDMVVNSYKAKALKTVLNETMNNFLDFSCSPKKLVVKGINVKISDVIKNDCYKGAISIEIFALNKVFLNEDIDKTGVIAQLAIIALDWVIIDNRKIILDGKTGDSMMPAKDGVESNRRGKDGECGTAGISAGSILFFGKTFSNDEKLQISMNGGKGGQGQRGGIGYDGTPGADPPPCRSSSKCPGIYGGAYAYEYKQKKTGFFNNYRKVTGMAYGKENAIPAGRGGDGGRGGSGGKFGEHLVFGVTEAPKFTIFNKTGYQGAPGDGGRGGSKTRQGWNMAIKCEDYWSLWCFCWKEGWCSNSNYYAEPVPAGSKGIAGYVKIPVKPPTGGEFYNPSFPVNNFKKFLRNHLPNNVREPILLDFLNDIEENQQIRPLYNTLGLINDLQHMESQYVRLRRKMDFMPFVNSLLIRTEEYMNQTNVEMSSDNKLALAVLKSAILSKLASIRTNENKVSVIDLHGYLNILQSNVKTLREFEKAANMDEYQNEYKDSLNEKIQSALELIQTDVMPNIESALSGIRDQLCRLLQEIIDAVNAAKNNLYLLFDKKRELEMQMILNRIMDFLKLLSAFLELGAKIAQAAAQAAGAAARSRDKSATAESHGSLQVFKSSLTSAIIPVKILCAREHKLFKQQLKDISNMIDKCIGSCKWVINVKIKVNELTKIIDERLNSDYVLNPFEIKSMREELQDVLNENKPTKSMWDIFTKYVGIFGIGLDIYTHMKDDEQKLDAMEAAIQATIDKLKHWEELAKAVVSVMLPMITDIQKFIDEIGSNLEGKEHYQLDITKLNIHSRLGDVKVYFKQMGEGTTKQPYLERSIEKLDEAFGLLINIYDRIASYQDKVNFADYFSKMLSGGIPKIEDPELNNAVLKLKQILQTNRVLEQYEVALEAFKQHQFPFAQFYLSVFELPDLQTNEPDVLVERAADQISYLADQVQLTEVAVGKFDREVFGNIDFHSSGVDNSTLAIPFYRWNYEQLTEVIDLLLGGEEIVLRADIRKGLNLNAVKFNEIDFILILPTKKLQIKFDAVLFNNKFVKSMSLIGNNYYRCDTRYYYISVDDNIVLEYSTSRKANGKRIKANEVYRKISEKGFFLSPYSMWKIQLKPDSSLFLNSSIYDDLKQFNMDKIEIELIGRGQYLKNDQYEVCNEELDKFYHRDIGMSIKNDLKLKGY